MRPVLAIPTCLAAFLATGAWLESADWFDPVREVMQSREVPVWMLDTGALGRILRGKDLVHSSTSRSRDRWRLQYDRDTWRINPTPSSPPPSEPLALGHLRAGWPLISVSVDEDDLYDPEYGILANWRDNWERPAHISYFDGTEHVFSAYCGLRLHGDSTRRPENREEWGASFRLHFREEYGTDRFAPGALFGPECEPVQRLILRVSPLFCSALAFDIVRRIGGDAPAMRPGLVVINDEPPRLLALSEQLSRRMWGERLGHREFRFYRSRSPNLHDDWAAHDELHTWAKALEPGEVTVETVGKVVDIDRLTRHLFSILWCGTDDWAQGAAVLDLRAEKPRWHWVNWDMDRSFRPSSPSFAGEVWEKPALDLILGEKPIPPDAVPSLHLEREIQVSSVRGVLFKGLLRDDPSYRTLFVDSAVGWLNHELAAPFLRERAIHYFTFANTEYIEAEGYHQLTRFLMNRGDFVRRDLASALGLDEPLRCVVTAPGGVELRVDGRRSESPYEGWYFEGQTVEVSAGASGTPVGGWRVNGELSGKGSLRLTISQALRIEAVVL